MGDLNLLRESKPGPDIGGWAIRCGVALLFLAAGLEKFDNGPDGHWVKLFEDIGFGTWFRYFTGVVELLTVPLLLVPRTVLWGIAIAACTMGAATALVWLRLGHPGDSVFPGLIFLGLIALGWSRWRSTA